MHYMLILILVIFCMYQGHCGHWCLHSKGYSQLLLLESTLIQRSCMILLHFIKCPCPLTSVGGEIENRHMGVQHLKMVGNPQVISRRGKRRPSTKGSQGSSLDNNLCQIYFCSAPQSWSGRSFFWYSSHFFSSPLCISPPLSVLLIQFYLRNEIQLFSVFPKRSPFKMEFSMSLCVCFTESGRGGKEHLASVQINISRQSPFAC